MSTSTFITCKERIEGSGLFFRVVGIKTPDCALPSHIGREREPQRHKDTKIRKNREILLLFGSLWFIISSLILINLTKIVFFYSSNSACGSKVNKLSITCYAKNG